jgi:hypothetical protein
MTAEVALAQDYLTTYGPGCAAFVVHHALEAAMPVDFLIRTFGGTKTNHVTISYTPVGSEAGLPCVHHENGEKTHDIPVL